MDNSFLKELIEIGQAIGNSSILYICELAFVWLIIIAILVIDDLIPYLKDKKHRKENKEEIKEKIK
ncbi:MAG: hypothetical protein NC433_02975 [Clostridiales bacterium]|nr:hypothetical protein [Clostridiales bacterium]